MSEDITTESTVNRQIKQLIPAVNFCAVFFDEDNGEPWIDSVVAWALAESSIAGQPDVVIGLVPDGRDVVFADDFPNFVGYLSPERTLDEWRDRAREAWEAAHDAGTLPPNPRRRGSSW
ncbi:MAG TPA: hypothetical protein VKM94_24240 [Blastocatellia bacterium]|nr:hypothetical protein [Blastocatellia bacterium]